MNYQKRNLTLESIEVSLVNIHRVAQQGKLKVLKVYKENIASAYVLDIEIEKPPPIYDRDTKNKADEFDRLHAAMKEKLVTASNYRKITNFQFGP